MLKLKKIQILGETIDIRFVSEKEICEYIGESPDNINGYGVYIPIDRTIYINKSLEPDQARKTLLHEIVHAHLQISGLSAILDDDIEEATCTALESLYSLFQNKEFIREMYTGDL